MPGKYKKKSKKTIIFLFVIIIALYVPMMFHWIFGNTVNTELLNIGTIEELINVEGVIVRDEELIISPISGTCITDLREGEKVSANQKIAMVLNDISTKITESIKDLDQRIVSAQNEKELNNELFSSDENKINREIESQVRLLISDSNRDTFQQVNQVKREIDALIQKKAQIVGSSSTSDVFVISLKSERKKLQTTLEAQSKEIYSKTAGLISYHIDGYETTLTPQSISTLTPKSINEIKLVKSGNMPGKIVVQENNPFAKMIKSFESRLVFVLDSNKAKELKKDNKVNVRVNEIDKTMVSTIENISKEQEGKCVITLKIDQYLSDLTNQRMVNIDLILNAYEGYKVPLSSLKDMNMTEMKAKLGIVKANYANFKEVKMIGSNQEYAIIDNIEEQNTNNIGLYSPYIVNPENIKEGQMISK